MHCILYIVHQDEGGQALQEDCRSRMVVDLELDGGRERRLAAGNGGWRLETAAGDGGWRLETAAGGWRRRLAADGWGRRLAAGDGGWRQGTLRLPHGLLTYP